MLMHRLLPVLVAAFLSLALVSQSSAQTDTLRPQPVDTWQPHMFYGGNIYLSFGSNGTSIGASPLVGWQLTRALGVGVGVTYIYYHKDDYTSHSYGGRVMTRYNVIPQAYAKAEFSYLWYSQTYKDFEATTFGVPYLFLGGGYRQRISATTFLEFEIMFDVLQDKNSQYGNWEPVYAVGVSVGM